MGRSNSTSFNVSQRIAAPLIGFKRLVQKNVDTAALAGFADLTRALRLRPLPGMVFDNSSRVAIQQVAGRPEFAREVEVRSKPSRAGRVHVASRDR